MRKVSRDSWSEALPVGLCSDKVLGDSWRRTHWITRKGGKFWEMRRERRSEEISGYPCSEEVWSGTFSREGRRSEEISIRAARRY